MSSDDSADSEYYYSGGMSSSAITLVLLGAGSRPAIPLHSTAPAVMTGSGSLADLGSILDVIHLVWSIDRQNWQRQELYWQHHPGCVVLWVPVATCCIFIIYLSNGAAEVRAVSVALLPQTGRCSRPSAAPARSPARARPSRAWFREGTSPSSTHLVRTAPQPAVLPCSSSSADQIACCRCARH